MAPTPRRPHMQHEAGLPSADGVRSARTASPRFRDSDDRQAEGACGLSSMDLATVYDMHHRRARKHIYQKPTKCNTSTATPSIISEPISDDTAIFHLGHRACVGDHGEGRDHLAHRAKGAEQAPSQSEASYVDADETAGLSSHFLNRKGRLGHAKKKYGTECSWVGYHHRSCRLDVFGREEKKPDPTKRCFHGEEHKDHIFVDTIEHNSDRRGKKRSDHHSGARDPAAKDVPIGGSTQLDLDTQGFLGQSKGRAEGATQLISGDPISDKSGEACGQPDLSCYGLNQRGKRKFLVQSNLDHGCRHNSTEVKAAPTLRSSSVPILERALPPNKTPYYQDDLPESARAVKEEIVPSCRGSRECDRKLNPRNGKILPDHTWDIMTWTPRMVDQSTAAKFIEGENVICPANDEEHNEREFRMSLGATKRSFGNAHNKSDFRFDYADDPMFKSEHCCETRSKDPHTGDERDVLLRWGSGHGRRKFDVPDHFYTDGSQSYMSKEGVKLGARNRPVPANMDPNKKITDTTLILDTHGVPICAKVKNFSNKMNDSVFDHMNDDVESEHSNMVNVTGMRRKSDLIRPHSARRFPQKDFEKVTPRSLTPRASRSEAHIPLIERPLWKK